MSEVATLTDEERMVNLGKEIELKKLGKVVVKELSLDDIVHLIPALKEVFSQITSEDEDEDEFITKILTSSSILEAVKSIAAACTSHPTSDFNEMGLKDWFLLVATIKEVIDFEEMKELFFRIVPREKLSEKMKQ